MSSKVSGRSVFVFVVIAVACGGAEVLAWQEQYWGGMRALQEGRYAEARVALQSAYDAARALPEDSWRARVAFGLGSLALAQGDIGSAERLHEEARTILEEAGDRSPLIAIVWNGLGEVFMEQARLDEAEKIIGKALNVFVSDPKLSKCAYLCRRHLAEIRFMRGEAATAEELLKTLLAAERKAPAESGPGLPATLGVLGKVYVMQNRLTEAEPLLREAMTLELAMGDRNLAVADTMVSLSGLYRLQGHIERAEPLLRKALKAYEQAGDPRAAFAYAELGYCAAAEKKYLTARNFLQKAVDLAHKGSMAEPVTGRLERDLMAVGPPFEASLKSRH